MLARAFAILPCDVRVSVRLSQAGKTAKRKITQTVPRDSPVTTFL